LALALPLALIILLEAATVALDKVDAEALYPVVLVMDVLIYVLMGLAFVLIPAILVVMLLLRLGKLRQPGLPVPPRAG
jgi:hypothetical protein